jgi:Coiled-coil domain-containing protein 55 (DUF2040)
MKKRNVFNDDEDEDEEAPAEASRSASSSHYVVNRELMVEQEAVRKRMTAAAAVNEDLYDYDGAYDQFHPASTASEPEKEEKGSRYIQDLLEQASRRKREREEIMDRKIIREQEKEWNEEGGNDKGETFVTASYKRKLQERELWKKELEEQEKNEVDVTKQGSGAIAKFYTNLHNTSRGQPAIGDKIGDGADEAGQMSNQGGLMSGDSISQTDWNGNGREQPSAPEAATLGAQDERALQLQRRHDKIQHARRRYFQRHSMSAMIDTMGD